MSEVRLKRSLTTKDLVIYGINFMIPIAPFAWYGLYVQPSNGMVALAYAIGLVAMLFTGFSYVTMSRNYPVSGSVYTYVQSTTNPALGFIAGWAMMLDYIFIPVVCYLVGGLFFQQFIGIPIIICVIVFAILTTIINSLGIKLVAQVSWGLFFLEILCIGWFLIGVIRLLILGEAHLNYVAFYNPVDFELSGVLSATVIVVISYLGFDAISTLAEETHDAKKSIGRATIISIVSIGILFVVLTYFAGVIFPDWSTLNSDTAFLDILQIVGGKPLVLLSSLTLVLAFGVTCGLEGQTAVTRLLFCMGRDKIMPSFFAKLNPKYNTPVLGTIFIGVMSVLVSFIGLDLLAQMLSFGALIGFMILNLAVAWRFYIKGAEDRSFIKHLVSPVLGFLICAYIFTSVTPIAVKVGGSWMLVGFIYLLFKTRFFTKKAPTINIDDVIAEVE
ncbi:MAG TPA: amino acid permease [Clostridia bacterium]|nr:amino acid permease [Clostridia bacterium]